MKIALVSEFFYPTLGGIQEHLYFFAKHLIRRGHSIQIITPHIPFRGPKETWWPKDLPPEVFRNVGLSLPFFVNGAMGRTCVGFRMGSKLKRLLSKEAVDLVHIHTPLAGVLAVIANHVATAPVVGTFHTSFSDSKNLRLYRPLLQRQVDKLSKVIAVSPIALRSIQNIFDLDAEIIPNGIDTALFRPLGEGEDDRLQKFVDEKINILFMGRADPRNGLGTLIKAFALAKKSEPRLRLLVAGGGELMSSYQMMAKHLETSDIEFLGPVRDERPALYRTAHIHIFSVERATFAVTLLEGMATGLPIVTSNFEGVDFVGKPGEDFVLADFGNVEAQAAKLVELARDEGLRKKIGASARKRAMKFSWQRIGDEIIRVYEEVLDVQRPKTSIM